MFRKLNVKVCYFETNKVCFETYFNILSLTVIISQTSISWYIYQFFEDKKNDLQEYTREHTYKRHTQAQVNQIFVTSSQRRSI